VGFFGVGAEWGEGFLLFSKCPLFLEHVGFLKFKSFQEKPAFSGFS
jgi:hypothetical protein